MTLRTRLLSLTLSVVPIVVLTMAAVSLNGLTVASLDVAIGSSESAAGQVQSFLLRRLAENLRVTPSSPLSVDETKEFWKHAIVGDADIASLLEQTMAHSRSIVEIEVGSEDGVILASSNPRMAGTPMKSREDLRVLREAGSLDRTTAILASRDDYETRVLLGIAGQKKPLFVIQILVSPVLLRAATLPELRAIGVGSGIAILVAFALAWWSSTLALRPLARISHLIDDMVGGKAPGTTSPLVDEALELASIEAKLSLLGEQFRGARDDASQLRVNLKGPLEKGPLEKGPLEGTLEILDAGTRRGLEDQIALARRLTAINSLTGRVAHEIKNPLNSIALRLEMLRSRISEGTPEMDEEFAIIAEEVMRLDRVVRTFLDFSRPVELALEDIDLNAVAAEITSFLEPEATARGIAIEFDQPSEPILVQGDRDLLRQALLNIAINAVEAMPNGGTLSLRVHRDEETCEVRIVDTGPGIPPDQQEKIFQLYFTTKSQGTGIGLAMAFRATQLNGGTIEVESEMGKYTAFVVTLPLAVASAHS
jgi:signal transduction histidine kinase